MSRWSSAAPITSVSQIGYALGGIASKHGIAVVGAEAFVVDIRVVMAPGFDEQLLGVLDSPQALDRITELTEGAGLHCCDIGPT
ncbi:hypothetical protein [Nocardia harenae]|uniref:hypothetical protein n=1 Tax=Nocardia harenae TaxID=358707 RepID=UPI000834DA99|nr:hypothetical protein [Nocardia harenae]